MAAIAREISRHVPHVEIHTPAKLNLFLEIFARRADGYHELETLMVTVGIFDSLRFSSHQEGDLRLTCRWAYGMAAEDAGRAAAPNTGSAQDGSALGDLPIGASNIVLRAVERLRVQAGVESGASIELVKRIPSAAGLGGASSDAAAALLVANHVWKLGWTRARLEQLAAELGSDIPFFFGTGASICRGRGERIEAIANPAKLNVVVVRPAGGLSTAEVYRHCQVADRPLSVQPLLRALRAGDFAAAGRQMTNRLQGAAERLSPWIGRMRREFSRFDCWGHQMSGSGTSYFGICRHARHARRGAADLRARGLGVVYCTTTSQRPYHLLETNVA